jgi:glycosyltransferase involved in cell wall biosynthesis
VDFEHFNVARGDEWPPDLPKWNGKVIGFWGLLEDWIDLDLIAHVATRRPDWLVVLIGHKAVDVGALQRCPNVVLVGKKSFAELPRYARCFDVGILPYRLTEQVLHSNPIKLREYLATGKPVVSVRFPHAEGFGDLVLLADGYDDFVAKLDQAVADDDPEAARRRIESVRDSTWEARAQVAMRIVAARVAAPPPPGGLAPGSRAG